MFTLVHFLFFFFLLRALLILFSVHFISFLILDSMLRLAVLLHRFVFYVEMWLDVLVGALLIFILFQFNIVVFWFFFLFLFNDCELIFVSNSDFHFILFTEYSTHMPCMTAVRKCVCLGKTASFYDETIFFCLLAVRFLRLSIQNRGRFAVGVESSIHFYYLISFHIKFFLCSFHLFLFRIHMPLVLIVNGVHFFFFFL